MGHHRLNTAQNFECGFPRYPLRFAEGGISRRRSARNPEEANIPGSNYGKWVSLCTVHHSMASETRVLLYSSRGYFQGTWTPYWAVKLNFTNQLSDVRTSILKYHLKPLYICTSVIITKKGNFTPRTMLKGRVQSVRVHQMTSLKRPLIFTIIYNVCNILWVNFN